MPFFGIFIPSCAYNTEKRGERMTYYKCKREIWSPSPMEDFPDVLTFKKGNLYYIENQETIDEEGQTYRFNQQDETWFNRHFEEL